MSSVDRTASDGAATASPRPALRGAALIGMAALLGGANFLAAFDLAIANVSVPNIAAGLAVSPRDGTWAITSYMVAEALTVPLAGWLSARFGPGRTLAFAMAGFAVASALCGFSTSLGMLVMVRGLQGLAGGPMIPLSQSKLMSIFPKEKAGTAMGIWAMTAVMGPTLGPIVGGQICDHWSWPWLFLINVPVAGAFAFAIWATFRDSDPPPVRRPVDVMGLGLMVVWIVAAQVILDRGQELDWFGSSLIVALTVVAVIGFVAFLIWELTEEHPIVNLRVLRTPGYNVGVFAVCAGFGTYIASIIISPLWLQTNMGYTAAWAGFVSAPSGVVVFCLSPFVGWLSTRVDARLMISTALSVFVGMMLWRAHFASNVTYQHLLIYQLMNGACMAFFFAPGTALALGFLKPQEMADGAGIFSFIRTASFAFATALATTYWQDSATQDRAAMIGNLHGSGALDQLGAMGFAPNQALQYLDNIVENQAVMMATNDTFYAFAGIIATVAICIWLVPRAQSRKVPAAH